MTIDLLDPIARGMGVGSELLAIVTANPALTLAVVAIALVLLRRHSLRITRKTTRSTASSTTVTETSIRLEPPKFVPQPIEGLIRVDVEVIDPSKARTIVRRDDEKD